MMASLHCVRGGKHRCLIDVGTQQGLLSRLCEVVSNTDGVRGERHTQLNSKSFSTAVSHTCEDEDDFVDKTIWVDLTNCHNVLSVKCDCLRPV